METLGCGEWPDKRDTAGVLVEGQIEVTNCSPCSRRIEIAVTEQLLGPERVHDGRASFTLEGNTRYVFYYTGSIRNLEIRHADVNVALSQRSLHDSTASQCIRSCERC